MGCRAGQKPLAVPPLTRRSVPQSEDGRIELPNGCICCTLGEGLVAQVGRLAAEGAVECVVVESRGLSDPMQVGMENLFWGEAKCMEYCPVSLAAALTM